MTLDARFEAAWAHPVAGVDEAGRGPLAGPVLAAAVVLPPEGLPAVLRAGIRDSKKLTPAARARAYAVITAHAAWGVGAASVAEIDRINILQATMLAMRRAVAALPLAPATVLVDGNRAPDFGCRAETIIGGDGRVLSIAAASIIAKVVRDRLMGRLARRYPDYGWRTNCGYGTRAHTEALARVGPTPHHRLSFAPVRAVARGAEE